MRSGRRKRSICQAGKGLRRDWQSTGPRGGEPEHRRRWIDIESAREGRGDGGDAVRCCPTGRRSRRGGQPSAFTPPARNAGRSRSCEAKGGVPESRKRPYTERGPWSCSLLLHDRGILFCVCTVPFGLSSNGYRGQRMSVGLGRGGRRPAQGRSSLRTKAGQHRGQVDAEREWQLMSSEAGRSTRNCDQGLESGQEGIRSLWLPSEGTDPSDARKLACTTNSGFQPPRSRRYGVASR